MAITLRQIIARNGGTTGSFRDQIENCRNPDYFAERNIRSMAAWKVPLPAAHRHRERDADPILRLGL